MITALIALFLIEAKARKFLACRRVVLLLLRVRFWPPLGDGG